MAGRAGGVRAIRSGSRTSRPHGGPGRPSTVFRRSAQEAPRCGTAATPARPPSPPRRRGADPGRPVPAARSASASRLRALSMWRDVAGSPPGLPRPRPDPPRPRSRTGHRSGTGHVPGSVGAGGARVLPGPPYPNSSPLECSPDRREKRALRLRVRVEWGLCTHDAGNPFRYRPVGIRGLSTPCEMGDLRGCGVCVPWRPYSPFGGCEGRVARFGELCPTRDERPSGAMKPQVIPLVVEWCGWSVSLGSQ